MIKLNYQTYNNAHGLSGIKFDSWDDYALVLGFLSNIEHHGREKFNELNNVVNVVIERNDLQGAWKKEGRIQYYGDITLLRDELPQLYRHKSKGNGNITCRINSNGYMRHLVNDYNFDVIPRIVGTTGDIKPSSTARKNLDYLINALNILNLENKIIESAIEQFKIGWNK